MRHHPSRIAFLAGFVLALASHAAAQQSLFALDTLGRIWRVDGHATNSGTLVPVAATALPSGFAARDLAFDPELRRFIVLAEGVAEARLLAVDPASGATTTECAIAATSVDGLDRRSDGVLGFQAGLDELVLVAPASCTEWRVPTAELLGLHTSHASLAFDAHGALVSMAPDGTALTIDPLDGATFAPPFAVFLTAHALEIDAGGDVFVGTFPWTLRRLNPSPGGFAEIVLANPPASATIAGLALVESAEGAGISHVCDGLPSSSGRAVTLELLGEPVAGGATLELRCRDVPPGALGYFLMGPNAGLSPVGAGILCVAPPVYRNVRSVHVADASGHVRLAFATGALPVGIPLLPGDSYVFQLVFRDAGPTLGFSAARRVEFR